MLYRKLILVCLILGMGPLDLKLLGCLVVVLFQVGSVFLVILDVLTYV